MRSDGVDLADDGSMRRRPRWRLAATLAAAAVIALLASGCEIVQLPDGGYSFKPDAPNGQRLLIVGDSLIRQSSMSTAAKLLPAGVETLMEAQNGGGLVSGPVHWDTRATELVNSFHPTVVVISILGNFTAPYWPPYTPPGEAGSPESEAWLQSVYGTPDWLNRNLDAAIVATRNFAAGGAHVYWLTPPPLPYFWGKPSLRDNLWNLLSTKLPTAVPGTRLLSITPDIADANGDWLQYKMICGNVLEIRAYEWDLGVHYTADGAGTAGRATARALSAAEGWPPPPDQCPGLPD